MQQAVSASYMTYSCADVLHAGMQVEQANTMVATFPSGIRHAGWLYKLVGKTPLDVNWKRYWVSQARA